MKDTFTAYYVKAPHQFELRTVPMNGIGPDEVVVRIKACGVCGWDVLVSKVVAEQWMGIGHECSGEVVEVGAAAGSVKVGDRVVVENATFCGACARCRNGDVEHCESFYSYLSPGAFAEYVKVKARSVTGMPKGMEYETAALAEPLTVALDMVGAAEIPLGATVAVFGPGPIGLMSAKLAIIGGARKVYLLGRSHSRARFRAAAEMGITERVFVDKTDVVAYFKEMEPGGLDRILITSPPSTIAQAIEISRFGAVIVYDGISYDDARMVSFDGNVFHRKRLSLKGVHSVPNLAFPRALGLLEGGRVDPRLFISHTFPFDEVPRAVKLAAENRTDTVKVMMSAERKGE